MGSRAVRPRSQPGDEEEERLKRQSGSDDLVVAAGIATDRDHASRLLMAGQVRVGDGDGARIDRKPGELVDELTSNRAR